MIVIKSENHGISWIFMGSWTFSSFYANSLWMDCDWMWEDVRQAGWESRNSDIHEVWKSWNHPSSLSVSRQLPQMWDHWDAVSNAAQQVLLSSVPGDGDVQVAFVFLCVTVTLRCTKLILRFWSLSLHWPRACKKGWRLYMQIFSRLLMCFIVLVLILDRKPSAWRDKPMRSKT